jgi:hypothetical protein
MYIRYRGNVSTEPLPSNDKGIFTEPLPSNNMGTFTEPLPSNDRGIHRQQCDLIRLLLFFQNKGTRLIRKYSKEEYTIFWDIPNSACHPLSRSFLARLILRPWRWRRYVLLKRRLAPNGLHGVISQKIVLFTTTAVKTSIPTKIQ